LAVISRYLSADEHAIIYGKKQHHVLVACGVSYRILLCPLSFPACMLNLVPNNVCGIWWGFVVGWPATPSSEEKNGGEAN
jgi:hypothetical protein